jgi:hypothetical protein
MIEATLSQLRQLKLNGMASALQTQLDQPGTYEGLSFAERLQLLVDHEDQERNQRKQDRLTIGDACVVIENDALYDEDGCLLIVPKGDASGAVVGQASSYHDEWDSFNESIKEADEWAFQNFVIANTSVDPVQALQRLLPSFNSCPALFGKRFQLELNESGQIAAVVEIR